MKRNWRAKGEIKKVKINKIFQCSLDNALY